jgi:hypothetical protein
MSFVGSRVYSKEYDYLTVLFGFIKWTRMMFRLFRTGSDTDFNRSKEPGTE